jgi:hypothetical protein
MENSQLLALFAFIFLILGVYNVLVLGSRRMREARLRNQPLVWYKQINVLTGIEYGLLAIALLLIISNRSGTIPASFQAITTPLYIILLLAAAIIAGLVIRQSLTNSRARRAASSATVQDEEEASSNGAVPTRLEREQQAAKIQRQRERRRNAAAARRRRTGRG